MDKIIWEKYSVDEFQLFCNALLSFEIGKLYRPFTAPGKDNGIDGWFEGLYQGRQGKWRFQAKSHNTARKTAVSLVKSDIKAEVAKIGEENVFVLLTNVELLPQEHFELIELFAQLKPADKEVVFELWDGAKLLTLALQYPLLWLWLDEGFKTSQLVNYKAAFSWQLNQSVADGFTLANRFVFREDKLNILHKFVSSGNRIALITGEAGIGKTRLVLEFFDRLEKQEDSPVCLVFANKNIDFDKLTKALSGTKKFLLFVDDAHEYDPRTIADLNALSATPGLSIQLVLTAREIQSHNSIALIKEYEQQKITRIKLEELTREETKALLTDELKDNYLSNYLDELTTITHGKPILIISVLRAAYNGMRIEELKVDNFLTDYVTNYFSTALDLIRENTGMSKLKAKGLLQLVCLVEPFNFKDSNLINQISGCLSIDTESVSYALELLMSGSFVSGRFEQSVKPDYYSDILLREANHPLINSAVQQFPASMQKIIANLASADEVDAGKQSILTEILDKYIEPLKVGDNINAVFQILETINLVSYLKPDISMKTVTMYIEALEQKGPLYESYLKSNEYSFGRESGISRITTLLYDLLYRKELFDFVYRSTFRLHQIFGEPKPLIPIFRFSKRDHLEKYLVTRQQYFVDTLQKEIIHLGHDQLLFAVECLQSFLILDYTAATNSPEGRAITITTYYIPKGGRIKKLRNGIIRLLITIFKSTVNDKVKNSSLTALLDIPRGISATKRNPKPYDGSDEIMTILEFLKEDGANIPQASQKDVLENLYWYTKWNIGDEFNPVIEDIKEALKPRNLTEQLIQLFASSELKTDLRKGEELVKETLKTIYEGHSSDAIADSLSSIHKQYGNKLYTFHLAISALTDFPELEKHIYSMLWLQDRSFIDKWGSWILNDVYFVHKDSIFFWKAIEDLLSQKSGTADNVILNIYSFYHASKIEMTDRDFQLIEQIARKNESQNHFSLVKPLVAFVVKKPEKGAELCREFLDRCSNNEADHLFLFLSDNLKEAHITIQDLILNCTTRFHISHSMEVCLNEVLRRDGNDLFFKFIVARINFKLQLMRRKEDFVGYDVLPDGKYSHIFDGIEDSVKFSLFRRVIEWYCVAELDSFETLFLKDLFESFNKEDKISDLVSNLFNDLARQFKGNMTATLRLFDVLAIYHQKDYQLLELIEQIYTLSLTHHGNNPSYLSDLHHGAYVAITEVGVKSGTSGEPFPVDIALRDLLVRYLEQAVPGPAFRSVLIDAKNSVDRDINRSHDEENETW